MIFSCWTLELGGLIVTLYSLSLPLLSALVVVRRPDPRRDLPTPSASLTVAKRFVLRLDPSTTIFSFLKHSLY